MDNKELHTAMLNSYDVIVNDYDAGLMIEEKGAWFAHDVYESINLDTVEGLLIYFEEIEDYERCAKIIKLMKRIWNIEITN